MLNGFLDVIAPNNSIVVGKFFNLLIVCFTPVSFINIVYAMSDFM